MNSIPQPSSLLRKNNEKRLSTASATRSSLLGNINANGGGGGSTNTGRTSNLMEGSSLSITGSAKRRSILLTPASANKRRQSMLMQPPGLVSQYSLSQLGVPGVSTVDQRPLRDKNYQVLIQQEIYDFLLTNKFELEMNHPLTFKTLKQPIQKDFVMIFQFLYNKIDPHYKFTRPIEAEVHPLLRMLNYPYLDGINRSQISAVGGQNWPNFLGVLYWLVKLNLALMNVNKDDFFSPDDQFDRIFINYITKSYKSYIDHKDDFSEFYEEMNSKFNELNSNIINDIDKLTNENEDLSKMFEELNTKLGVLESSEKKSKALENDLIKFKAYIETMEARKPKWNELLEKINKEIDNCEEELAKIEEEKKGYEKHIEEQGLSPGDIDNLNNERDKLSKSIDLVNNNLDEFKEVYHTRQIELQKSYQSLENFLKQYNNLIYKIQLKSNAYDYDFEINLNANTPIINNGDKMYKPDEIINKNLKDEKFHLLNYKSMINSNIHKAQDEQIKLQEQLDLLSEATMEKREEIETLEAKLAANKSASEEIYETMINDTTTYSMQIEKLERELRSIKINTNQGFIEVENKFQNIQIEYDELLYETHHNRSVLHDNVQKIIESTIGFKINIQLNLEDLENLTFDEYEKEDKKLNN